MSRPVRRLFVGFALCCVLMLPGAAQGTQIASNINGSNSGFYGVLHAIWGATSITTSTTSEEIASIVAPVRLSFGASGDFYLQVYSNVSGHPGIPIGSKLRATGIDQNVVNHTFTAENSINTTLSASTKYWIVAAADDFDFTSNAVFQRTTLSPGAGPVAINLGILGSNNFGATWDSPAPLPTTAFRMQINSTAIPEPSSLILGVLGLVGLAAWGLRTRLAAR